MPSSTWLAWRTGGLYAVVLVYSTGYVLRAEEVLTNAGIDCKLIPVSRHLSPDCGVCMRVGRTDRGGG